MKIVKKSIPNSFESKKIFNININKPTNEKINKAPIETRMMLVEND